MAKRDARIVSPVVLVVDDEADILELLEITLLRMGLEVVKAGSVRVAIKELTTRNIDFCLTDMRLPDGDGLEIIRYIQTERPQVPVAVMTAHGNMDNAVTALKAGAFDYLSKPVTLEQLRALIKSALRLDHAVAAEAQDSPDTQTLAGKSAIMDQTRAMIARLARTQAPVYITGESGSGKELAARLIHQQSVRAGGLFVPVNCGAIPENLMESEFFGYRKGSFTGADSDRDGFFQAAHGGTLFLDEVADLPLLMQVKLLRVIQEKRVRKIGATQEDAVDVRIISATHQNLAQCVEAGKFRQDLFFRLNVIALRMPSLREMREDIPLIAHTLLLRLAQEAGRSAPELTQSAMSALQKYDYPGNVREMENILERVLALNDGQAVEAQDLQLTFAMDNTGSMPTAGSYPKGSLREYLDRLERVAIEDALAQNRGDRDSAAVALGISVLALRHRLERLGMN